MLVQVKEETRGRGTTLVGPQLGKMIEIRKLREEGAAKFLERKESRRVGCLYSFLIWRVLISGYFRCSRIDFINSFPVIVNTISIYKNTYVGVLSGCLYISLIK